MWSVATVFQIEELLKEPLPSGAMVFWELHKDVEGRFVKAPPAGFSCASVFSVLFARPEVFGVFFRVLL